MPTKKPVQPEPEPDDYYETDRPDGRILMVVDGENHYLKRPKIGLQRELEELLADIQTAEREAAQWQIAELGTNFDEIQAFRDGAVPPEKAERLLEIATKANAHEMLKRKREIDDMRVAWWHSHVFPKLCPDLAAIEDDDLPAYLRDAVLINEALKAWAANPRVPGGR